MKMLLSFRRIWVANLFCWALPLLGVKWRWHSRAAEDSLLYEMARHLKNDCALPVHKWGTMSMDLLVRLREMDPKRYDDEMGLSALPDSLVLECVKRGQVVKKWPL